MTNVYFNLQVGLFKVYICDSLILLYCPNASHVDTKCEMPNLRAKIMSIVYFNLMRMLISDAQVSSNLDLN